MAGRSLFHVALLLLHLVALARFDFAHFGKQEFSFIGGHLSSAMAPYDLLTGIEGTPDHEYCDEYRELIQWCTLIKINTTLLSDPEKGASVRVPDDDVVVLGRMTEVLKGKIIVLYTYHWTKMTCFILTYFMCIFRSCWTDPADLCRQRRADGPSHFSSSPRSQGNDDVPFNIK